MFEELTAYLGTGSTEVRIDKYQELFNATTAKNFSTLAICLLEELDSKTDRRCAKLIHSHIQERGIFDLDLGVGSREMNIPGTISKDYYFPGTKAYFFGGLGLLQLWFKHRNFACALFVELLANVDDLWQNIGRNNFRNLGKVYITAQTSRLFRVDQDGKKESKLSDKNFEVLGNFEQAAWSIFKEYDLATLRTPFDVDELGDERPTMRDYDLYLMRRLNFRVASDCDFENSDCPLNLTQLDALGLRLIAMGGKFLKDCCQIISYIIKEREDVDISFPFTYSILTYIGAIEVIKYIEWFRRELLALPPRHLQRFGDQRTEAFPPNFDVDLVYHTEYPLFTAAIYGRLQILELMIASSEKADIVKLFNDLQYAFGDGQQKVFDRYSEVYDVSTYTLHKVYALLFKRFPKLFRGRHMKIRAAIMFSSFREKSKKVKKRFKKKSKSVEDIAWE